jgi:hypothetical protein
VRRERTGRGVTSNFGGAGLSSDDDSPFERPRPPRAVRILTKIELGLALTFFAVLPALAGVFIVVLAGRASTSAATQSAATTTATVVSARVIAGDCKDPCYKSVVVLTNLAQPAGDGTRLVIKGQVSGSGTRPGATLAVKQDPSNPRHVEIPGYPDSPRLRQWTWTPLAVIIGLVGIGIDFLVYRRFARTGHLGNRVRLFTERHLYRRPRPPTPPGPVTTGRLARHYLLPALGVPIVIALCIVLAALGASATSDNDIAQLNAVGTSSGGS